MYIVIDLQPGISFLREGVIDSELNRREGRAAQKSKFSSLA